MNDHNLDDLIIDSIEPNHSKTKSFLTIVALLIVFLIVGIVLAKIYTNDSSNATLTLEKNNSELIAPELKLQEPSKVEKPKDDLSLSNIIEQEIKQPAIESKKVEAIEKAAPVKQEVIPETVKKETVQITKEYTQEPKADKQPVKIIKEPKPKKVEEPVIVKAPKPVVVVPQVIKQPVVTPTVPKTVSNTTYFIQVGSFTQTPSTRFLAVIKNSGFSHQITKASANGVKKLLIGPYGSRASVDSALIQVRDRINKKAFVVKK